MTNQFGAFFTHAHKYAGQGFSVLPIIPGDKAPLVGKWSEFCGAAPSHELIDRWISTWPTAGIGVACGSASNITVLDIDLDLSDPNHMFLYKKLQPYIQVSPIRQIGRKGMKYVFRHGGERVEHLNFRRFGEQKSVPIIDLLGTGSQTVVPPSIHPAGMMYRDVGQTDLLSADMKEIPVFDQLLFNKLKEQLRTLESYDFKELDEIMSSGGSEGRNNRIKPMIAAAIHNGKTNDEIVSEIVAWDKKYHDSPLFESKDDYKGGKTPEEKALLFIGGIRKKMKSVEPKTVAVQLIEQGWPGLLPLPEIKETPTLRDEHLMPALRSWIAGASYKIGMPHEMIMVPAMISLGTLLGRKVFMRPKDNDEFKVPMNLWGMIVARPGRNKTDALKEGMKFLEEFEDGERKIFNELRGKIMGKKLHYDEQIASFKTQIKERKKLNSMNPCEDILKAIDHFEKEERASHYLEKRFIIKDSTWPTVCRIHQDNPNGLLVFKDELSGLLNEWAMRGRETDRTNFLSAWSGNQYTRDDRMSRESLIVETTIISLLGGIQPSSLAFQMKEGKKRGVGEDGFLQRFQMGVYPDNDAYPSVEPGGYVIDERVLKDARNLFLRVKNFKPSDIGADSEIFLFDQDAQAAAKEWYRDNLKERNDEETSDEVSSHVSKFRSFMPKLALIYHIVECLNERVARPRVSFEAMQWAAWHCDFFKAHALKIYALGGDEGMDATHALAKKLRCGAVTEGMTIREIQRHGWKWLETKEKLKIAIETLEDCRFIRTEEKKNKNGTALVTIFINPAARI